MSLNSKFTVVLDGINCFSARFCDSSLVLLKMRLQAFSFARKSTRAFQRQEDINFVVIIAL